MEVSLIRTTDLNICANAIKECHDTTRNDELTEKDVNLIDRVGNQMKHGSVLEHLLYTFQISGISRAVLQELARHRMASLTVKSSRYTLKELKNENSFWYDSPNDYPLEKSRAEKYLVMTSNELVNDSSIRALEQLRRMVAKGISNDITKYCMPESYKTSLTWTINARSLQNFLELRTSKAALWEIRNLSNKVFEALPKDHKFLFENFLALEMNESSEH
jgi:thymidylate synthase (FAD)